MKACLTSHSTNYDKWFCGESYSYSFLAYPDKNRNCSRIGVNFEETDYPLFSDMQKDDEFELEVILTRKPKIKTETKTFK
jgi:hypothetical protein